MKDQSLLLELNSLTDSKMDISLLEGKSTMGVDKSVLNYEMQSNLFDFDLLR